MAHLVAFLNGMIMFSGLSKELAVALQNEIFSCMRYIKIPYDSLMHMPTRDRRYFIKKHNEATEEENAKYNKGETIGGAALNSLADVTMQRGKKR